MRPQGCTAEVTGRRPGAEMDHPGGLEVRDVGRVDLVERRVAAIAQVAAHHRPVVADGLGDVHPIGGSLRFTQRSRDQHEAEGDRRGDKLSIALPSPNHASSLRPLSLVSSMVAALAVVPLNRFRSLLVSERLKCRKYQTFPSPKDFIRMVRHSTPTPPAADLVGEHDRVAISAGSAEAGGWGWRGRGGWGPPNGRAP